jgi:UDP-N-acetylglucosamine 2-epimerase (non-hydrolysing)
MPEEINRILTDHCSDYLFAPTEKAKSNLLAEGISEGKIFVTGNTIVDAVYQSLEIANGNGDSLTRLKLEPKGYLLVTLHRQENVDDNLRFKSILRGLAILASMYKIPVVYPIHPRSRRRIDEFNLMPENLTLIDPVDFFEFIQLEKNAKLILTDSGGVQEESCILGTPCVTLRDNTERPETLDVSANILAGTIPEKILECTKIMLERGNGWHNPFGDGKAGEKIVYTIIGGHDVSNTCYRRSRFHRIKSGSRTKEAVSSSMGL